MGGVTLHAVMDRAAAVLAADAALLAWCATHYVPPKIQIGLDERNRPGPEDCPVIVIRPDSARLGQTQSEDSFTILIDWAVYDETISDAGPARVYTAVRRVDELGVLIWSSLVSGFSDRVALDRTEYALETVERFPLVLGGMDITINVPRVIGAEITL